VEKVRAKGKALMLDVVDEEGDLTYYDASVEPLKADVPRVPRRQHRGTLLEDRVLVLDADEGKSLFADGWFGRDVGVGLQLSLPEAAYLAEEGKLDVRDAAAGAAVTPDALVARA